LSKDISKIVEVRKFKVSQTAAAIIFIARSEQGLFHSADITEVLRYSQSDLQAVVDLINSSVDESSTLISPPAPTVQIVKTSPPRAPFQATTNTYVRPTISPRAPLESQIKPNPFTLNERLRKVNTTMNSTAYLSGYDSVRNATKDNST